MNLCKRFVSIKPSGSRLDFRSDLSIVVILFTDSIKDVECPDYLFTLRVRLVVKNNVEMLKVASSKARNCMAKVDITIAIRLRYDYDTTIRRKIDMLIFLLASNGVEWKQARAIRRSRIVVVS